MEADGYFSHLCLNGHTLSFEGNNYIKGADAEYVDVCNCKDQTEINIFADLKAEIDLTFDIRTLIPDEYKAMKQANIALYHGIKEADGYVVASKVDRTDNSQWTAAFEDVPLFYYNPTSDDDPIPYDASRLNVTFENVQIDDSGYITDQLDYDGTTNIFLGDRITSDGDRIDDPMLRRISGDAGGMARVTVNRATDTPDQDFTVNLLLDGEVVNSESFNPAKNVNVVFEYQSDGEYLPGHWDGQSCNYAIELADDTEYIIQSITIEGDNPYDDGEGWPQYLYEYTVTIGKGTNVDKVDLAIDQPKGNVSFPNSATIEDDTVTAVKEIAWYQYGSELDPSATAEEGETYQVGVTVEPANENYAIPSTVAATVNGGAAEKVVKNSDGTVTVYYKFTALDADPVYQGYDLAAVNIDYTGANEAIEAKLPKNIKIKTTKGERDVAVTWTDIPVIDEDEVDGQTVKAKGTFDLPPDVRNTNNVSTDVTLDFNVGSAPQAVTPTVSVGAGTYAEDQTVTLSTTTGGADIYYTLNGDTPTVTNGKKYTEPIQLKGSEGEEVKTTIKAIAVKEKMRSSEVGTFAYTIDVPDKAPAVTISDNDDSQWKTLLNNITFGLFFKDSRTVTIDAEDYSGIESIEYLVSEQIYTANDLKSAGELEWKPYTGEFTIEKNSKNIVYARVTDKAENANVTYVSSDGFVIYTDSEKETGSLTYTKLVTLSDTVADVTLNGNTVYEIKEGGTALTSPAYSVDNKTGKITFSKEYLESLDAGKHTLTISYNPLGEAYVPANGNDAPETTDLELKIINSQQNKDGSYTADTDGNGDYDDDDTTYIPVDNSGDDATDEYKEVTPNDDGSYTDENKTPDNENDDDTYIPVDRGNDGITDEFVEVEPDDDGYYSDDADGDGQYGGDKDDTYIQKDDGLYEPMKHYVVTDGELTWIKGSGKSLTFTVDAPDEKFEKLVVTGEEVNAGEYSHVSGSTIITLNADYLEGLSAKKHDVKIWYIDGTASTSLTIKTAEASVAAGSMPIGEGGDGGGDGVDSGDDSDMLSWLMTMMISLTAAAIVIVSRKRNRG